MRRLALFSDIHANLVALDAVLADIEARGVTERVCVGDLVGYGPDPTKVVRRVRELGIPVVMGNYDDGTANRRGDCGCYYASERARQDGAASYEFTLGRLGDRESSWLAGLPFEYRTSEGMARVLAVHGSPRRLNEYLTPDRTDAQLARLAIAAAADIVCVGHTHVAYHRAVPAGGAFLHYVNAGSVGKPKDGDPRACWVELLLGDQSEVRKAAPEDEAVAPAGGTDVWVGSFIHRVPYAVAEVAEAMRREGLPDTLGRALLGE